MWLIMLIMTKLINTPLTEHLSRTRCVVSIIATHLYDTLRAIDCVINLCGEAVPSRLDMAFILSHSTWGHLHVSLTGWGPLMVPCGRLTGGLGRLSSILKFLKGHSLPRFIQEKSNWLVWDSSCNFPGGLLMVWSTNMNYLKTLTNSPSWSWMESLLGLDGVFNVSMSSQ